MTTTTVAVKLMTKRRREDIWELLYYVSGQACLLRDGTDELLKRSPRYDYIEQIIDLRDKLQQVSELIEETVDINA